MVFLITSSESLLFDDVIRNIYNKHTIINKGYSACFKSDCNFHLQLFSDYHLFDNHYLKIFPKLSARIKKYHQILKFYYSFMAFKAFGC